MAEGGKNKWVIERLNSSHDRKNFDSGVPLLNDFLTSRATQFEKRDLGRTFVAVSPNNRSVLGYYTLASSAVSFETIPHEDSRRLPSQIPIPVLRLGRLAVDKSTQGQGLGAYLLIDALRRGLRTAAEVAIYAVEVDAISSAARQFYEHFGFVSLLDDQRHLYLPMKKVARLFPEIPSGFQTPDHDSPSGPP